MDNNRIQKLKHYLQKGGLNYWDWLYPELQQEIKNIKTKLEIEEENKLNEKLESEIFFRTRRFNITRNPSIPQNISWNSALLNIPDMISGGNSGKVIVNYYQDLDCIYLKTVEKLEKKEFENIFDFNCGHFTKYKIISLDNTSIQII